MARWLIFYTPIGSWMISPPDSSSHTHCITRREMLSIWMVLYLYLMHVIGDLSNDRTPLFRQRHERLSNIVGAHPDWRKRCSDANASLDICCFCIDSELSCNDPEDACFMRAFPGDVPSLLGKFLQHAWPIV